MPFVMSLTGLSFCSLSVMRKMWHLVMHCCEIVKMINHSCVISTPKGLLRSLLAISAASDSFHSQVRGRSSPGTVITAKSKWRHSSRHSLSGVCPGSLIETEGRTRSCPLRANLRPSLLLSQSTTHFMWLQRTLGFPHMHHIGVVLIARNHWFECHGCYLLGQCSLNTDKGFCVLKVYFLICGRGYWSLLPYRAWWEPYGIMYLY